VFVLNERHAFHVSSRTTKMRRPACHVATRTAWVSNSTSRHPGLIARIGRLLAQDDDEIVGSAEDGSRLLEKAARLQPDVIVLDLFMPALEVSRLAGNSRECSREPE
jgi:hypothetical protein